MIFKCKMCGGELEVTEGASVAECPYCGAKQTLPKLDNERRANLYDRAGHFRRMSDFDKAMALYEQILNEDTTDAEAYWSIVLCRYGIEYVEDPATHKRIPTVNRVQRTSVLADEDYKSALTYADGYQRELYEAEAKEIEEIQKGILAISEKEEPFDVFICYKETDANGERTRDSVLANDLYYELTKEGYKVFFSRITLEDKLGTAYEPYIFAALQSARVMVVVGTKAENFNAPWVKNEWSRYLALIRSGAKKTLIPAYRDMDPYDLPDAFSHLQAQDMSKLGFMQDLTRGIKKLLADEEKKTIVVEAPSATGSLPNAGTVQFLKRARIFIEDGDWQSADEYVEHALDIDPEDADAYLLKMLITLQLRSEGALNAYDVSIAANPNYIKALRYSKGKRHEEIASYETQIQENIRSRTYQKARELYQSRAYSEARSLFLGLGDYRDAKQQADTCVEAEKRAQHENTVNTIRNDYAQHQNDESWLASAIKTLGTLNDYAPALELRGQLQARLDDVQAEERAWKEEERRRREEAALQAKREAELQRIRCEKRRQRVKHFLKWAIPTVSVICVLLLLTFNWWIPAGQYHKAEKLIGEKDYVAATKVLRNIKPGFRNCDTRLYAMETVRAIDRQSGQNLADDISHLLSAGIPVKVTYETVGGTLQSGESVRLTALSDEKDTFGTVVEGENAVCFYQKSADFTDLETVAKDGYQFLEWKYVTSSLDVSDKDDFVAVALRAVWTTKAYTLAFNLDGGTIEQELPTRYGAESSDITILQPTKKGYTFVGWTGTGLTEPAEEICIPTGSWGDRSYTAVWQANTYTLTLDANGGTCDAETVTVTYDSVPVLPTPVWAGHTFSGWYYGTKAYGSTAYVEDSDLTLTAAWDLIWYPVTYHLNGGKNAANNVSTYNVRTGLSLSAPTRKGYTFIGWTYTGHDSPEKDVSLPAGTIGAQEFTAVWQANTYTLTLNANGGTCEANTVEGEYGTQPTISVPIRDGFTFGGWYTDINLANAWGGTVFSDLTLYAYWSEETKPCDLGYETYGNGYQITDYTGSSAILWLPVHIGGKPVVAIAGEAFGNKTLLTKVVIPDSVTSIGGSAFSGCTGLTSITIPNSVTSIGGAAFCDCTSLTSITIPNSVTSIETAAFSGCTGLTSITIPDSVTSIGSSAFSGCKGLTSITIPFVGGSASATSASESTLFGYIFGTFSYIGGTATKQRYGIYSDAYATYYIPSSLTKVTVTGGNLLDGAFENCTGLTSITIPGSVTSIELGAFEDCKGLTSITIPDSVTSVGNAAFSGCTGLTSVTIGNGVTSIGDYAFSGCKGLTSITIPDGVTGIADSAFRYCTGLTSVTIGNGVTSIGANAFDDCTGLTSVTIGSCVTSIGYGAFENCTGLTSITIPFVGGSASATSASESTLFGYIFGTSSYTGGTATKQYYKSGSSATYYIPSSLKEVTVTGGNLLYGAFYGCTGLTSITIPNSVTSIGYEAFYGCTGLTSVTLGNGVTSIGDDAFRGCTGLTSVTLGNGVTSIGDRAFYGCTGLTFITMPTKVTSIGQYAFSGCTGITSVTIPDSVTSIEEDVFSGCMGLVSITIPSSVRSIGGEAFSGCKGLTSVTIPNSVTSIGYRAFSGCTGLTAVTIGNSVTSIGDRAFSGCTGLTSIQVSAGNTKYHSQGNCLIETGSKTLVLGCKNSVIPSDGTVTSIGNYAFYGCTWLASITIPDSVTSIGSYAFSGCKGLTSVTIGNGVTSVEAAAFYYCTGLTSVTIGNGVTSIGEWAFDNCTSLTTIRYGGTVTQWKAISKGDFWADNTGNFVVYCSDGTIAKDNA